MDDLGAKLTELLNDPESMERVKSMAESILGADTSDAREQESPLGNPPSGDELKGIMSVISHMKSAEDDPRIRLIHALIPHLSEERRLRAETAIKLLKLIDALPLLKESGLLKLL